MELASSTSQLLNNGSESTMRIEISPFLRFFFLSFSRGRGKKSKF